MSPEAAPADPDRTRSAAGAERSVRRGRLDRRGAVVWVVVVGGSAVILGALLVPWGDVAPRSGLPRPTSLFTTREIERAEALSTTRRTLAWTSLAVGLGVSCAIGLSPLGARLSRATDRLLGRGRLPLLVVLLLAIASAATLAPDLLLHRELVASGLSTQSTFGWLGDRGIGLAVEAVVLTGVLGGVLWAGRRWPRRWFVPVGAGLGVLVVVASFVYPLVVEPLFNRFEPLSKGPVRSSVLELAHREGVELGDVVVADASRRTTTLNAYVSGLGGTRRVVLYDTLLQEPLPEVRQIVAHELAHAARHDVGLGTALGGLGLAGATGLWALASDSRLVRRVSDTGGAADPHAAATLLALVAVATLLASPVQSAVSRAVEARADRDSLALTGDAPAFVALQRRLARRSLQDPTPPDWSQIWFGSHPTVLQRVALAEREAG